MTNSRASSAVATSALDNDERATMRAQNSVGFTASPRCPFERRCSTMLACLSRGPAGGRCRASHRRAHLRFARMGPVRSHHVRAPRERLRRPPFSPRSLQILLSAGCGAERVDRHPPGLPADRDLPRGTQLEPRHLRHGRIGDRDSRPEPLVERFEPCREIDRVALHGVAQSTLRAHRARYEPAGVDSDAVADAMCCDNSKRVTACESTTANVASIRIGMSRRRTVAPRVADHDGARHRVCFGRRRGGRVLSGGSGCNNGRPSVRRISRTARGSRMGCMFKGCWLAGAFHDRSMSRHRDDRSAQAPAGDCALRISASASRRWSRSPMSLSARCGTRLEADGLERTCDDDPAYRRAVRCRGTATGLAARALVPGPS